MVRAFARRPIVSPSARKSGGVESLNRGTILSLEGEMYPALVVF